MTPVATERSPSNPIWRRATALLVATSLGALGVACRSGGGTAAPATDDAGTARHTSFRRARLAIHDPAAGRVAILDVEDAELIATLDVPRGAALRSSQSGENALLLGDTGVSVLFSGVSILDHKDHVHIYKSAPKLRTFVLGRQRPLALVSNQDWIASVFGAGGADPGALAAHEPSLARSDGKVDTRILATGASFDLAVPLGPGAVGVREGRLVAIEPGSAPRDLGPCVGPGQPALSGWRVAIPCQDAVVVVTAAPGAFPSAWRATELPNPAGGRLVNLTGHPAATAFFGAQGPRTIARVDLSSDPPAIATLPRPLLADACDLALEGADARRLVMLGADGRVRAIALDGRDEGSSPALVGRLSCAAGTRPRMALAPERAYVTDPAKNELHDIDLRSLTRKSTLSLPVRPIEVAVLGVDLKNASLAPGGAHPDGGLRETDGGGLCRAEGPCAEDSECCSFCHDKDHCH